MQCRKGILPICAPGICEAGIPHLSWHCLHTHTHILGRNGLLLCQIIERTGVGQLPGLQEEWRPFSLHPAARFSVLSVLGDAVLCPLLTPCYRTCQTCISKTEELLNWAEEVLNRVLGLGCEAALYNAESVASASAHKCKEQENCSFLFILLLYLHCWQALQICHLLSFLH